MGMSSPTSKMLLDMTIWYQRDTDLRVTRYCREPAKMGGFYTTTFRGQGSLVSIHIEEKDIKHFLQRFMQQLRAAEEKNQNAPQ